MSFPSQRSRRSPKRVVYLCSRCRRSTVGPHDGATASVNIGVAARIIGAAPGGPRYDPSLTSETRRDGDNGLAVKDYTHSTAPNRRYPDLTTQRLLKAAIAGRAMPYSYDDLVVLATHFTEEEDAANKVERQVSKSAAAILLESRIGEQFEALVTGTSEKGTWARLLTIPVEGRVVRGFEGVDVGDQIRVQLVSVNVERGFIDFTSVHSARQSKNRPSTERRAR